MLIAVVPVDVILRTLTASDAVGVASLLMAAFREHWPRAWPTLGHGLETAREMLEPGRIARAAVAPDGSLAGVIGGIPDYDGRVWELHPLAVRPDLQGHGIGRALVADLEARVAGLGALTVVLGTDDEDGMTTLADANLYDDLWSHVRDIRDVKRHPFVFYRKLGYVISGVVPDANGRGKPDILMAKRIG